MKETPEKVARGFFDPISEGLRDIIARELDGWRQTLLS
jgi:hypothetical protein